MAQIRYFKATNGRFTVFRASTTRVYLSAWIQSNAQRVTDYGFSLLSAKGRVPAEEMTKAEYDALNARKVERIVAAGGDPKHAAPADSWVANLPKA
jgi:hypothetical protein